jgi:hypothetical protein
MDKPSWSDSYTPDELAAALAYHAAIVAKQTGLYSVATEMLAAAECIADLAERLEKVGSIGAQLRANIEAFGRQP